MRQVTGLALVPLLLLPLAACGHDGDGGSGGDGGTTELTVLAAASLTDTFTELARTFEAEHDGVEVRLSFGGSSDLATQIVEGAPADVFASADEATMSRLTDEDLAEDPVLFATNRLELAVPPGNPGKIDGLDDLDGVDLVVCAPAVPCGAAALAVAQAAGVKLHPVSEEQSVTDVLGKVTSGEADAGLVYVTDVLGADGDVAGVEIPEAASVVNRYPITVVAGSKQQELAEEFTALVTGSEGQQVLAAAGFGAP